MWCKGGKWCLVRVYLIQVLKSHCNQWNQSLIIKATQMGGLALTCLNAKATRQQEVYIQWPCAQLGINRGRTWTQCVSSILSPCTHPLAWVWRQSEEGQRAGCLFRLYHQPEVSPEPRSRHGTVWAPPLAQGAKVSVLSLLLASCVTLGRVLMTLCLSFPSLKWGWY